jgi:hypothetical protein
VSGLESLPPDQRAVLQLILAQGRGYADLAASLRLDPAAVRERAHTGAAALVGEELDADMRGRVVDYLLGQQDADERIVTFAELGGSAAAARWAQALREQLATVAREELPEVPAVARVAAAVRGNGAATVAPDPAEAPTALASIPPLPAPPVPAADASAASAPPSPPREPRPRDLSQPTGPRPSRLGGAILIAGALALVIVLAIVLIGRGDDGSPSASTSGARTQAQTSTQTSPSGTNARAQVRTIGTAVLRPAAGGSGLGAALVQQSANGSRLLALEAGRLPGNAGQDFYGIWLQGSAGSRFLGFVPRQVRANGAFTVSSNLPRGLDLSGYATVLVTTEDGSQGAGTPTTPGTTVLSGPLRLAG